MAKCNIQLHLSKEPLGLKTDSVHLHILAEHIGTALTPWVPVPCPFPHRSSEGDGIFLKGSCVDLLTYQRKHSMILGK
ncbi:hypothetical protein TNCV_3036651 [Trichonephila clavipes]|nr:hypothetical protein TNCV_3036651 [Trichonephila clavipes]